MSGSEISGDCMGTASTFPIMTVQPRHSVTKESFQVLGDVAFCSMLVCRLGELPVAVTRVTS